MNEIFLGTGCRQCPAYPCYTTIYRGSICAATRDKLGLEDPLTLDDALNRMTPEQKAKVFSSMFQVHEELFLNMLLSPYKPPETE